MIQVSNTHYLEKNFNINKSCEPSGFKGLWVFSLSFFARMDWQLLRGGPTAIQEPDPVHRCNMLAALYHHRYR